jgi:selenophosphate synthetase-related protein
MSHGPHGLIDVAELARQLADNPALRAKADIALVGDVLGGRDWLGGPGDDGAVVPIGDGAAVACGEALLPRFVAADPYGAGLAAIVANVNDVAAMGGVPRGVVNTAAASRGVARAVLRCVEFGTDLYRVPLVGGHLTIHDGAPALSAFAIGSVGDPLSATRARAGQSVLLASCTLGRMRDDFPFFASFDERGTDLAEDVRALADVARTGACVAAKDVSMAGIVGSLAMLLEQRTLGVTVDLDAVACPEGVPLERWLMSFPAFAFLLCAPPERTAECAGVFRSRGLAADIIGTVDDTGIISIAQGERRAVVLDLKRGGVIGLPR